MLAQLAYIRSRRHFMIWIMKRTGLRPSEMVDVDLDQHADILQSKRIIIPTRKRRRTTAPVRSFPITLKDAAVFHRYMTARMRYVAVLNRNGLELANPNALFVGVKGEAIKKSSLEREFSRLVHAAGFHSIRTCLSMFRHRFITYEVIVHLKEFMAGSGKGRQMMTKSDNASVLKRIASKTGHGSIASLWNYIDLAWEEIDVWGGVDKAINRLHAADRLHDELLELIRELNVKKAPLATKKVIQEVSLKLRTILDSGTSDIAAA
ncbi:site-specific integrase [Massilia putida]|uniref:site-specific integrase n=1 Tax=Massilia putida TaxID=1141883 RepID=UPI00095112AB|nr:site-specific integrase [Massilia putida]